jgi:lysylphosphatidylglycerol synthetase-like protein (DUF2156 family)
LSVAAGHAAASADAALSPANRRVLDVLRRHGDHTSAFLAFNRDMRHYFDPEVDGMVAYRPAGRGYLFQLCGPFCAPADRDRLVRSFLDWAGRHGRRVVAVQLRRDDAQRYAQHGFSVNHAGCSYSIDLEDFTLRGTRFMKLRNKLKRSRRLGVEVEELDLEQLAGAAAERELAAIDAAWVRSKGALVKQMEFMVGERGGRGAPLRRVFVARCDGRAIAYVTYSPCFGERPGWLYDLTRRLPDSPPGTVELIFHTALERLREENCRWLHLGLTPLVGLAPEHEIEGAPSRGVRFFLTQMAAHGQAIYPAASQEAFKLKWAPQLVEPEYLACQGGPTVAAVWHLMRLTRAI